MQEYNQEFADIWFKLPSSFQQKGGIWIVRAGRNEAKPNYDVGPKIIECHSLHFIMEGELRFDFDGKQKILKAGDLFCLFPYISYSYGVHAPDKPPMLAWFALDGAQVPDIVRNIRLSEAKPYLEKAVDFRAIQSSVKPPSTFIQGS